MTIHPHASDFPGKGDDSPLLFSFKGFRREERRGWTRFVREPGTDFATVITPLPLAGRVEVIDESLGGLGLVVADAHLFHVGQVMEVVYTGSKYQVQVRHITRREDGRYLIGVGLSLSG